jgi:succinate dehydrogenase / fumarate reductase flavoprotein subunit
LSEEQRDYYLERRYPSFGNLAPRDIASRAAKVVCDEGRGVGETKLAVYLDFRDAIKRDGEKLVRDKYGNLGRSVRTRTELYAAAVRDGFITAQ